MSGPVERPTEPILATDRVALVGAEVQHDSKWLQVHPEEVRTVHT